MLFSLIAEMIEGLKAKVEVLMRPGPGLNDCVPVLNVITSLSPCGNLTVSK